jgi:hypothetical protein
VTIVVPFLGSRDELPSLAGRLAALARNPGDEALIVDNVWPPAEEADLGGVRTLAAGEVTSPAYARNAGAARASGEWLVFLDADTDADEDLIDRYFQPEPAEGVGILAGWVVDHPGGDGIAARLARETGAMSQEKTLANEFMPYAVTANCAIRRSAFEAARGFDSGQRAGEDADLCWRLQRDGWLLETRPEARVLHRSRPTLAATWRQRFRHGAGAGWLEGRFPGSMPRWGLAALARDSARELGGGARERLRGHRGSAALAAATVSGWWAYELGRRFGSNGAARHGEAAHA